jgi:hypothetical protein
MMDDEDSEMDEFLIRSASGSGMLQFSDRIPYETDEPIQHCMVRLRDLNLSASAMTLLGYPSTHPALLFENMARLWSGWPDELQWASLEHEVILRCLHDRKGHVSIHVELRSGPYEQDWNVAATVMTEAGQLDDIARRARAFFGRGG